MSDLRSTRCALSRRFARTREDFTCDVCDRQVNGNGYTNHCPDCLWSKHVDIQPGDRAAVCRALMAPIAIEYVRDEFVIVHRCTACGTERRNRASASDQLF